jgi:mannose-1-phosphate guanylyltransferase
MFCFTARAILDGFARHAPQVLDATQPVWNAIHAKGNGAML